ncbi:MAG: TIGR02710 family CRISPR-associated CARF protein [Deltaproteobacteria bacterium]
MPKALVVSLGGSIDPILKSIESHKPDYICFFSSQQSNSDEYPKVKNKLVEAGISPAIESIIVDDPQSLDHCYEKALELSIKIEKQGISLEDVVIDFTGGTKPMSAALVLATVTKFTHFSYVGGTHRSKGGLGVVISGAEEIKTALSPWQVLYVEDRKKIALFFNSYQFSAAKNISEKLSGVLSGPLKAVYESLTELIALYELWDSFEHKAALSTMEKVKNRLGEYLKYSEDKILSVFLEAVNVNIQFLKELSSKTQNFKESHFASVFDLFHNARRRAEEGKYDDAVARLYRSLEMIGQIEFKRQFGCDTSDADAKKLPESLREEMKRKHTAHDGKIKIPLYDTFALLKEAGSEFGRVFFEREEDMKKILAARNSSILAHGLSPVSKETFEKLVSILEKFLRHTGADYKVEFPKLGWA